MIMKSYSLFRVCVLAISLLTTVTGMAQNCSSSLSVMKDRSVRTIDENGAGFNLLLTNNSNSTQVYQLSAKQYTEGCKKGFKQSLKEGAGLEIMMATDRSHKNVARDLKVAAGQTLPFYVNVTNGDAKKRDGFYCIKIIATTNACRNTAIETTLTARVSSLLDD